MNKFISFFNQNKERIIKEIAIVVFGLLLLYFFNSLAAKENNYENQGTANIQNESARPNNIETNSALNMGSNSISNSNSNVSSYITEVDIIENFIKNCNEANTTDAYNMISNECKEIMYPTLETFIKNYYNNNFESNKIYNIQRWTGSIYKVDLKENMLQTGKLTSKSKQDYITVIDQNGELKLNINNYIGKTNLNIEKTIEDLRIKILCKNTYMDYETYTFEIKNNSNTDIYLDNLENTSTIYLVDENDVKHTAHVHKIAKEDLHIYGYSNKTMQITFSNRYISGREYSKIIFENVVKKDGNSQKIILELN